MNTLSIIVQIIVALSILSGGLFFILKWCFSVEKRITRIEYKIDNLPGKIQGTIISQLLPFASNIINQQTNPLTNEQIQRMRRLMKKLEDNSIKPDEATELKEYLEIEKEEAEQKNNSNLLLAIGIALAAIAIIFLFTSDND